MTPEGMAFASSPGPSNPIYPMKNVPTELIDFLAAYDHYVIATHKEPDGDCVGSSLALDEWLRRTGKTTTLLSSGPFKRTEIKEYQDRYVSRIPEALPSDSVALVVLDCSNIERVGEAGEGLPHYPTAIVDHHATNAEQGGLCFLDASAPSTTVLIQLAIEKAGKGITQPEAEYLLFGLCTDTGFFRHLDDRSSETFACASRLIAVGANPKKTFARMNGNKSFGSRILISRILSRMKRYYGGKLVVSYETMADTEEYGLEGRDSDALYQLIQSIGGVEAIVIVRQESAETCTVGFRSLDRVDVSRVAVQFGGGGHRQASGLAIEGTIDALTPKFIAAFADQFPGIPAE